MSAHATPVAVRAPRQSNDPVNPMRMLSALFAQRVRRHVFAHVLPFTCFLVRPRSHIPCIPVPDLHE